MKSLEILDDIHIHLEDLLEYIENDLQERQKSDELISSIHKIEDNKASLVINMNYGINKIKQDLEVLEIIKNKKVDICELIMCINIMETYEQALEDYNVIRKNEHKLTMEELLKLNQWLEVNE